MVFEASSKTVLGVVVTSLANNEEKSAGVNAKTSLPLKL